MRIGLFDFEKSKMAEQPAGFAAAGHKMKMGRSDFDKLELAHFLKNP